MFSPWSWEGSKDVNSQILFSDLGEVGKWFRGGFINKAKKKKKSKTFEILVWKEEIKLALFIENMNIYTNNTK